MFPFFNTEIVSIILFLFQRGHIPKARYFDQLEYTTPTAFIPRGLPDVKSFEDYLTRLGVSNDHHIVLYDRSAAGFFAASRAWFLLKVIQTIARLFPN